MVKLPASDKTSTFGPKPRIKKGYYPGKLLRVEEFTDGSGNAKVGLYGKQLIFEFVIFNKDENDKPTTPMKYVTDATLKTEADVIIPKFVYHEYKKKGKDKQWIEGEFQTAITPKSAITRTLEALGWKFSAEGVDPDDFIGCWVELNIDDYEAKEKNSDETYTASTIGKVSKYSGPEVGDVEEVKATEKPKAVSKQVKHEATEEHPASQEEVDKMKKSPIAETDIEKLKAKIVTLEQLNKDGLLTDQGLKDGIEQTNAQIEELSK